MHARAAFAPVLAIAAAMLAGCSSDHLPADVRTISLAPAARRPPVVLAPAKATAFARMADAHGAWAANQLRATISRELANGGRFQPATPGQGDAEITIESLRHGLVEVSADHYAVTLAGTVTITHGAKNLGQREFSGTGGDVRPLADFEDPKIYEEALQGAFDKVALELTHAL